MNHILHPTRIAVAAAALPEPLVLGIPVVDDVHGGHGVGNGGVVAQGVCSGPAQGFFTYALPRR